MTSFRRGPLPRTIAHRGGSGLFPENTLEAFRGAYAMGVRTMELDVHLSADGALVVHHDDTLDRTTNGTGPVAFRTLADLRSLDAAYRFVGPDAGHPFRGRGVTVPTLDEVLEELPDVSFVVELKPKGMAIATAVRRFVDRHRAFDRLCIAGFDEPTLACFRDLDGTTVRTSAGRSGIARFLAVARAGIDRLWDPPFRMLQVPPSWRGLRILDRRFVAAAHRRGIEVHAWTIDEPDEMRRLLALGVDAIITDRPDRMAEVERAG